MDGVLDRVRDDSERDTLWVPHPSDDDGEDTGDDVVAIIDMLRDHFALSDDKLTRSEQLRLKEEAFLDTRSRNMEEFCVTSGLGWSGRKVFRGSRETINAASRINEH